MKAIVIPDASQSLALSAIPKPSLKPGCALVRLRAASLNRRDVWIKDGHYAKISYPVVPGSDGAGVVEAVADATADHWLGQDVLINPNIHWGENDGAQGASYAILGMPSQGTLAEYVCVPVDRLHRKPTYMSYSEAAALPLAGLTAYRSVVKQGGVQQGERVLISGIGGGVACFALQFALAAGADVYVSSTQETKIRAAMDLGARGGLTTGRANWTKEWNASFPNPHLIVDSIGGPYINDFLQLLEPGGRLVSYGATLGAAERVEVRRIFWKQLRWIGATMGSDLDFESMIDFVSRHEIKPIVDSVWPLAQSAEAFAHMQMAQQLGKIVVEIA